MRSSISSIRFVAPLLLCALALVLGLALPTAFAEEKTASEKAVSQTRISVDVPVDTNFALSVDVPRDEIRFRYNETGYNDGPDNTRAPQRFISHTKASIGVVSIADDTTGEMGAARADFTAKIFRGKQADVIFTVSAEESGEDAYTIPLGGSVKANPGECLNGFTIGEARGDDAAEATFWLGMDLTALSASDVLISEQGQIACLCYTVAIIDSDDLSASEA